MVKAVIFDFDGTIVDTESLWYKVYYDYFKGKWNYELSLDAFVKGVGGDGNIVFQEAEQSIGTKINQQECRNDLSEIFNDYLESLTLREGILDFIAEADSLGLDLAIATSSYRAFVVPLLEMFDIKHYFPIIKSRDDVHVVKPDPTLYLKAINKLGVDASEAIAIEDSTNGSVAAVDAGIHCIVVPNEVTEKSIFPKKVERINQFSGINLQSYM